MGRIAELGARRFSCRVIVTFVQAQMLRLLFSGLWPLNNNRVQRQGKQLGVGRISSADAGCEWPAIAFNQETLLDARLRILSCHGHRG